MFTQIAHKCFRLKSVIDHSKTREVFNGHPQPLICSRTSLRRGCICQSKSEYQKHADAERAIGWVEELYRREFVGTESRFLSIFNLLEEIAARSTEDVEQRLVQLQRERAAIDAEIAHIRENGRIEPLTSTQVKERFLQAGEVSRLLLRDFAAVEQNFRDIARNVQEQELRLYFL